MGRPTEPTYAVIYDGGEELVEQIVRIADARFRDTGHSNADDAGRRSPLEHLRGEGGVGDEPLGPPGGMGHSGQHPAGIREQPGGVEGGGRSAIEIGQDLFGAEEANGQRPLPELGNHRKSQDGAPGGDSYVQARVVSVEAHHGRDERHQPTPAVVGHVIVDLPRYLGEKRMGALGVITPPLAGQKGGVLHEARPVPGTPMLSS